MDPSRLYSLTKNSEYLENVGADFWLMDDHRWAFYIWQKFHADHEIQRFSLLHADYHWDGINGFLGKPGELQILLEADNSGLLDLVKEDKLIRFDSFIAPAIIRGVIAETHFYCRQDDGSDQGIDQDLLEEYDAKQFIHTDFNHLAKIDFRAPLIFDLCLDLFNDSDDMVDEGDIWEDERINAFLDSTENLIVKAKLVTVSLSFGYSGSAVDTRHIASVVVPRITELRQ